jgi:hypothetical protein
MNLGRYFRQVFEVCNYSGLMKSNHPRTRLAGELEKTIYIKLCVSNDLS